MLERAKRWVHKEQTHTHPLHSLHVASTIRSLHGHAPQRFDRHVLCKHPKNLCEHYLGSPHFQMPGCSAPAPTGLLKPIAGSSCLFQYVKGLPQEVPTLTLRPALQRNIIQVEVRGVRQRVRQEAEDRSRVLPAPSCHSACSNTSLSLHVHVNMHVHMCIHEVVRWTPPKDPRDCTI